MLAFLIPGIFVGGDNQADAVVRICLGCKLSCLDGRPKVTPDRGGSLD
jgi:hypothetical protein